MVAQTGKTDLGTEGSLSRGRNENEGAPRLRFDILARSLLNQSGCRLDLSGELCPVSIAVDQGLERDEQG